MKKIILFLSFLILIFNCEKKTTIKGMVGQKLHLAPTVMSESDTAGCFFRWEFVEKPANSKLDVLNFQPDNSNYNIYFIPDVAGEYIVKCMIIESDGIVRDTQKFICNVAPDTTAAGEEEIPPEDTAEVAPEYGEIEEDTQITKETEKEIKEKAPPQKPRKKVPEAGQPVKSNGYKYTIQLVARRSYTQAKQDMELLKKHNLDVYLQKRKFEDTGETWYRIRTGTFDNYYKARANSKKLANKLAKYGYFDLWVDYLRK